MRFPDYPSNREADERARSHCRKMGRRLSKMMLSRETCLHIYCSSGVEIMLALYIFLRTEKVVSLWRYDLYFVSWKIPLHVIFILFLPSCQFI